MRKQPSARTSPAARMTVVAAAIVTALCGVTSGPASDARLRAAAAAFSAAQSNPITYEVRFPEPEHHWLEVTMTVTDLGTAPLRVRMSRSSPGRYAVHEFAKNVFSVAATDSQQRPVPIARSGVDEWRVDRHDGTVRVAYRLFGDTADGTYMAVDTTHAHLNMPATFMWAEGLDRRPIAVSFAPPPDSGWLAATQLFPTASPLSFTAPNLQYFMDSPVELARLVTSAFQVPQADGAQATFRVMAHTKAAQSDIEAFAGLVRRVVVEQTAVFGALPRFDNGTYTFIIDAVPWVSDDAMEHRNSTYISLSQAALDTEQGRRVALGSIAHEFFHVWNVERIRPQGLEPFDFTRENITCCLWLAEGFTEYYGPLSLRRAGLSAQTPINDVLAVITNPARTIRSAVGMSELAPFTDAGISVDRTDHSRTFISYYTYGAAIALGLDLALRDRSNAKISLDDVMRQLWVDFGAPPAEPGYVARPYSLADLRNTLAAVAGDISFASDFFDRYVEGHETIDYGRLLARAGYTLAPAAPERSTMGRVLVAPEGNGLRIGAGRFDDRGALVPFDTPAYRAGLDAGDLVVAIDGQPATMERWNALATRPAGTVVPLTVQRRDGRRVDTSATLVADPSLRLVDPATPTTPLPPDQAAFRAAWLESRAP